MSSLNTQAIFSDGTSHYVSPEEPNEFDLVKVMIRTAKDDVEQVNLIIDEKTIPAKKIKSDHGFDYYQSQFSMGSEEVKYHFELHKGDEVVYYNQDGVTSQILPYYEFRIIPGFQTPAWARGAVMYQIFVDRFYNGDASNDVEDREYIYIGEPVSRVRDWNKYPAQMGVREFYGGDLKGVLKKLDYLQELGVEVLYLNPIFVSPSNHKYDTQDYDYIDPHYTQILNDGGDVLPEGDMDNSHATKYCKRVVDKENLEASNAFFAKFVEEVHSRGMKVILDGVFNHCGSFNKWLDREKIYETNAGYEKGAYVDEDSPYRTFFKFYEENWPYNEHYDGWWGHHTLPKLNYEESKKLFDYIMRIAKKWVSPPYNIDGWRLDVAADLGHSLEYNHFFWKEFRKNVKSANPNALILAEHYGDVSSWLGGKQWDTVMNYDAFMEPLTWFMTGMEKHSDVYRPDLMGNADAFWGAMRKYSMRFTWPSYQVAMNELSNHDHSRFLTRTNHMVGRVTFSSPQQAEQGVDKNNMIAATMFMMTWPGAPTIYYGDEVGLCGWTDPDNRRTYPWGREDVYMLRAHKELVRIHRDYETLRTGSVLALPSQHNLLCYGRFDEKDQVVVVIYIGDEAKDVEIPVWRLGVAENSKMVRLCYTNEEEFSLKTEVQTVLDGKMTIHLESKMSVIYKNL